MQAAVEEARQHRVEAEARVAELREQLEAVRAEQAAAKEAVARAAAARKEAEGHRNAAARRLAELGAAARSAKAEADRIAQSRFQAEQARDRDLAGLTDLEERLRNAEATPIDTDPSTVERDELAAAVPAARQHEIEVRLAVRTAEERVGALSGRADALARQAAGRAGGPRPGRGPPGRPGPRRRDRPGRRRRRRASRWPRPSGRWRRAGELRDAVVAGAGRPGGRADRGPRRGQAARRRAGAAHLQGAPRRGGPGRAADADRAARGQGGRGVRHRRRRPCSASTARTCWCRRPRRRSPRPRRRAARRRSRCRYDRAAQEKRAAKAERELALLGKVNPLALEEFAAMEERFKFLSDQLEDVKATRRDLLTVVKDVDDRILEVFASAFDDTAREFEQVFTVLFPGGEGRLVLTDPDDMLTTGIEVEARPPGKKIKRLSLLSGGERSLTAVALLCAIFRARPSPFYIMDEVEAALDDVNLGRLLTLMEQLREKSQLIIITHQKRTMEIADALYGVTMRAGVTQVISQRLRDVETAA